MSNITTKQRAGRIFGCMALACCGLSASLGLCGCQPQEQGWSPDSGQSLYDYNLAQDSIALNHYAYEGIESFHDYRYYVENDQVVSKLGIDVSDYQGHINWSKVKASGIDFAVIRAGYRGTTDGGLFTDERFAENLAGAKAQGIEVGVYFFSQALNADEAREEAAYLANILNGENLDLPVVFDLEQVRENGSRSADISHSAATEATLAFAEEMEKTGYNTMVYMNKDAALNLFDLSKMQDLSFWYAEYETPQPALNFDFNIWQYMESGKVYGIDTNVDLNLMFSPVS